MSDQPIPITLTGGPWYVRPNGGAYEIVNAVGDEVIAMTDSPCDAAIMAASKEMLSALISIQAIITDRIVDDNPVAKTFVTANEINAIIDAINHPFGKIANEVPA